MLKEPAALKALRIGDMDTYRVFINYSHEDRPLVKEVVQVLRENGLDTL